MRVHELAKATSLESKEVLSIAKRHRVAVKPSPSANIEDKDVRKLYPLIEKYKAEVKAQEAEEKKRKEEERLRKEEERRKKDEERRKAAEEKKKHDEEAQRKKDEEARLEAQRRAEGDRARRAEEDRTRREEQARLREEDERMRALGFRVPVRPAGEVRRPAAAAPTVSTPEAPADPVAPAPQAAAPGVAPTAPPQRQSIRPTVAPQQGAPRPQGPGGPRPAGPAREGYQGQGQRPSGPPREGGYQGQRPAGTGYQGQRPGGPAREGGGYQGQRPGGPPREGGYQGQRPAGGGYQGQRPGGPPREGGGYQGQRPAGTGYQGQRPGGPPREGGYQGQRPPGAGYQGQRPGGPPREGGYQGQRPAGGGYQGQRPGGDRPGYNKDGPPQRRDGGYDRNPAQLSEGNLPEIGVMRLDKPRPARDKDKKAPVRKDARNKPKPSRIFEIDEDMTQTARPKGPKPRGAVPDAGPRGPRRGPRPQRQQRRAGRGSGTGGNAVATMNTGEPRHVRIEGDVTTAEFASRIGISAAEIIKRVLMMGEMINMNQVMKQDMMELLAPEFNVELEVVHLTDEDDVMKFAPVDVEENKQRRPPVVTIMGHVDHGKTSLLDYIRKSDVVEGEFGGITQHIGAYHVPTSRGDIVFLDTPGHEAFTSMRARGASITDIVILVVAANDGFMPQTLEAIHHAQAAKVPLVVAVNKVDLPGADPAKVRQEALQHNLVPEDFGGDTIFVDISAKTGANVEQLLEMVALQAEILDLKADPQHAAVGTVVESHVDPQRGAVATILVQKGTLKQGDYFVAGEVSGRVRAMVDDHGKPVRQAGPSFPVEIIGLTGSPTAGETFLVLPDERAARDVAEKREIRRRMAGLAPTTQKHVTLEGLHSFIEDGKVKELNIILKGDVQGSIEAVSQSLEKLSTNQVRIKTLHSGVGGINDSDVNLAIASDAIIIGFNVRPEQSAAELAEREGVDIKLYRIIYDVIEDIRAAMTGMLDPKFREKVIGHAEVRQLFKVSRIGTIAGCFVRDGEILRDSKVRVVRDNIVVYEGNLSSLKRFKEDVKRVQDGLDCGLSIENFNDIKEGDIVEAYTMEQVAVTLESAPA